MEESIGLYPEKQKMLTGQRTGRDVCISDICTSRSFVKNRSIEKVYFSDYKAYSDYRTYYDFFNKAVEILVQI